LADISSICFLFQLPAVTLLEMSAYCANADTETISPCIDSSNPDFASCFLNL